MMTFLKLLFFSEVILLTPEPVDLHVGANTIPLPEPIEAISPSASVRIDVISFINPTLDMDLNSAMDKARQVFSSEKITATLVSDDGVRVVLVHGGGSQYSRGDVWISMTNNEGVPEDVEFIFLQINTTLPMKDVRIYWKNYVH